MLALLPIATKASNVTSGAVLTLVLPLGITLIALGVWWYLASRSRMSQASREIGEADRVPDPVAE
jgi:hypothetical protein